MRPRRCTGPGRPWRRSRSRAARRGRVGLTALHDVTVWLAPGEREQVTRTLRGRRFVYATVAGGDYYGEVVYRLGGHILKTDALAYAADVEQLPPEKGIIARCLDAVRGWFGGGS